MLRFLADEDFNNRIVRGLLRRRSTLDIVRVQDTVLFGASDFVVLEWANQNGRVLLTHDVNTVTKIAYERLRVGEPTAGVIAVPQSVPIGQVIEDILTIADIYSPGELEGRIEYLPL